MKAVLVASAVSLATAFLIPGASVFQKAVKAVEASEDWDLVLPTSDHFSEAELLKLASGEDIEEDDIPSSSPEDEPPHDGPPHDGPPHHGPPHHGPPPHHRPHHHPASNKTVYELISGSNYTHVFGYLLKHYASKDVVSLLNGTDHNVTVFTPLDSGFKKLHDHWKRHHGDEKPKKPSNETIEKFIEYHIVKGLVPAKAAIWKSTLPTLLDGGKALGGEKQRIRIRWSIFGVNVNFLAKVRPADIPGHNGLIHGLSLPLFPPPPQAAIVSFFPTVFSTLSLALNQTGLGKEYADLTRTGGTLFAPSNKAWEWLGPKANAFLFSPRGAKYLKALLKYHIVVNQTFYTDALYGNKQEGGFNSFLVDAAKAQKAEPIEWDVPSLQLDDESADSTDLQHPGKHYHVDLPTLLDDKPVGVDVGRWLGFIRVRVNRLVRVGLTDALASDGVIQVVSRVLIPHHDKQNAQAMDAEVSVEELKKALEPLIEKDAPRGGDTFSEEL